jgi:hypothetical protein
VRGLDRLDAVSENLGELLALDGHLPRRPFDEHRQKLHGPENPQHFVVLRQIAAVR